MSRVPHPTEIHYDGNAALCDPDSFWHRGYRFDPSIGALANLLSTLKPSLEQQVDPDFVWLVVADANISEDLRAELTEAICDRDNFVLSMVDPTKTLTMDPTRALRGNLPPDASMVIVQRIDDDDLVHPEMVARTKAE